MTIDESTFSGGAMQRRDGCKWRAMQRAIAWREPARLSQFGSSSR
jgi:hypothetical protein